MNYLEHSIIVLIFMGFLYEQYQNKYKYKIALWWYSRNTTNDLDKINKESINLNQYDDL